MSTELPLDGIPEEEAERYLVWRVRVVGLNINNKTLLATDYANHFNEIVMLIEMIPDMPDMIEDCKEWAPKGYQQHFVDVNFPDHEIVVEAYENIPTKYRERFEGTVEQLNNLILTGLDEIQKAVDGGDDDLLRRRCKAVHGALEKLTVILNGLIHGNGTTMDQAEIDDLIAAF